ncbi:MAG: hypothetical protein K9M80_08510 [Candidatus Marinimicrobia bacterium]|nr:hypothetical protein [Candidatus Neomarinimicrobiota bacterium]
MTEKTYDLNEVVEMTGVRPSQINYLVSDRRIDLNEVKRKGSGRKREFSEKAVTQIREYYNQD